jgi:hypothetical protein
MKNRLVRLTTVLLVLVCLGLLPKARAVNPAPDGGYANFNTAEGDNALFFLTNGSYNTATGTSALGYNTTGNYNTANGYTALYQNTTEGGNGHANTANGAQALLDNRTGYGNTANGYGALGYNSYSNYNTANGALACYQNAGNYNTANGANALYDSAFVAPGNYNTATGVNALYSNSTGSSNVAVGVNAGFNLTIGSGNVCIGVNVLGVAGESNTTRIRNVYSSMASGRAVYVNSDNKIGTLASSRRYKEEIKPMDKASEAILALKPVTFRYKNDIDPNGIKQFGLVAEEVDNVTSDLVTRDERGTPETARYEAVNAMLLNEFIKEHRKVQDQEPIISKLRSIVEKREATAAEQRKEIKALAASVKEQASQIQKASARLALGVPSAGGLEASKSAPKMVFNSQ